MIKKSFFGLSVLVVMTSSQYCLAFFMPVTGPVFPFKEILLIKEMQQKLPSLRVDQKYVVAKKHSIKANNTKLSTKTKGGTA